MTSRTIGLPALTWGLAGPAGASRLLQPPSSSSTMAKLRVLTAYRPRVWYFTAMVRLTAKRFGICFCGQSCQTINQLPAYDTWRRVHHMYHLLNVLRTAPVMKVQSDKSSRFNIGADHRFRYCHGSIRNQSCVRCAGAKCRQPDQRGANGTHDFFPGLRHG